MNMTVSEQHYIGALVTKDDFVLSALVGRQIRKLRKLHGWSQTELAERSGLSRSAIAQLEIGRYRSVDLETVVSIARALNVAPAAIVSDILEGSADIQKAVDEFTATTWGKAIQPTDEEMVWLRSLGDAVWIGTQPGPEAIADIIMWRRRQR